MDGDGKAEREGGHEMRFQGLDLNLLVALNELLAERNLTVAANKLNLSQPAMSAALARLRAYFDDDLFRMQGRQMIPTPFAEAMATPTREALLHIKAMLATRDTFDPTVSDRCFRVVLSDYAMHMLFCRVVARIARVAPKITFDLLPFDEKPEELIRRGEVDFLIFPNVFLSSSFHKEPLFEERLVGVAWRDNPEIADAPSFSQYMSMGHVATQFGRSHKPSIEDWLMVEHGLQRRIEVTVQSFTVVPHLIVGTNRIGTMCERLAIQASRTMPLRIFELPVPLPPFTEALQWSQVHKSDPAAEWVRKIILDEASLL